MLIPKTRTELLSFIYSAGTNQPAQIQFHSDGGHGWLQVPTSLLDIYGIAHKISNYSYQDDKFTYLEEDGDLTEFFKAIQLNENKLSQDFWNICPDNYKDNSPVRRKLHYQAPAPKLQTALF